MADAHWLDNLKFRVGYGQTANQAINPYTTLGSLGTTPYNFGTDPSGYMTGYFTNKLANDELGWEYSETYNYGLDFSLFGGRLSGTAEYYVMNTKDILLNVSLPGSAGVSSYTANIGETQNKGFELTLNGTILDNYNGWTWEAGINLAVNRNKLVKLTGSNEIDPETGKMCVVTSPALLNGNGYVRSETANDEPYNLKFKAYERASIPSWFYSEPTLLEEGLT